MSRRNCKDTNNYRGSEGQRDRSQPQSSREPRQTQSGNKLRWPARSQRRMAAIAGTQSQATNPACATNRSPAPKARPRQHQTHQNHRAIQPGCTRPGHQDDQPKAPSPNRKHGHRARCQVRRILPSAIKAKVNLLLHCNGRRASTIRQTSNHPKRYGEIPAATTLVKYSTTSAR